MKLRRYIRLFIMTTDDVKQFDIDKIAPINKRSNFKYMDDEKIIMNASRIGWVEVIFGIAGISFLAHGEYQISQMPSHASLYGSLDGWYGIVTNICWGMMYFFTLLLVLHGFSGYFKKFELNRKKGTITYPNPFFAKTMKFSKAKFFFGANTGLTTDAIQVALAHENGFTWSYLGRPAAAYFSFYVWYMDKNRPLPPGTVFDAYREKDNQRRAAEGFPDYLYPSVLPISDPLREAYMKEHPKEEEPMYTLSEVDQAPEFNGNYDLWMFINKDKPKTNYALGNALVIFCIEKDGSINLIKLWALRKEIANELSRLVLSMPPWKPGKKDGKNVRVIKKYWLTFEYPSDQNIIYHLYDIADYDRNDDSLNDTPAYVF